MYDSPQRHRDRRVFVFLLFAETPKSKTAQSFGQKITHFETSQPLNRQKRAHSPQLAARLAIESKIGKIPYREDSLQLAAGNLQLLACVISAA
jgi:hypothetical protein